MLDYSIIPAHDKSFILNKIEDITIETNHNKVPSHIFQIWFDVHTNNRCVALQYFPVGHSVSFSDIKTLFSSADDIPKYLHVKYLSPSSLKINNQYMKTQI